MAGGGFAGLACARRAAQLGLSTLVLERQPRPGRHVRTTGILVREAWEAWPVPSELVRRIRRVRVYAPSLKSIDVEREDYFFMATDTAPLLGHLASETRAAGAEVRFGAAFEGATPAQGGLRIRFGGEGRARCRFLVGADGARSPVAAALGLDRNTRLLKGVEWEFEPRDADGDCLHCFIDPELAPGYIGWLVPGVVSTQVGVALHRDRRANLRGFIERLDPLFGLSGRHMLERRGGLIPIGGPLRNFFGERVLLTGDAAGLVSPLTAGGIHTAYRYGALAAEAIAHHLRGGPHPGPVLRRAYPRLAWKRLARWSYDRLPVARAAEAGLLGRALFRRTAERVFFTR